MPGVMDTGYLNVPFNHEIPEDREERVNQGRKLFPEYIDNLDRMPRQHYNINNSNQIYDLGQVSRFYGGEPITFTDPNGGHPGFIQYDNKTGRTRFAYQNLWQKDKDNHNKNLMNPLFNYERKRFDEEVMPNIEPYIDDQTGVPSWWWAQTLKYGQQYDALDSKARAALQKGQFEEAARIVQEEMPALRYEIQKFTDPKMVPVEYKFLGQVPGIEDMLEPDTTDELEHTGPEEDPYEEYLYHIGMENPGGPDPKQYPPEKNRNLYETYWDYDPKINYEEFVPPESNPKYDPNAEYARPQLRVDVDGPATE